jgi:cell division septation protein DedD
VPTPSSASPSAPDDGRLRFQLGIFAKKDNADALVAELGKKGFVARVEKRAVSGQALLAVVVEGGQDLGSRLKNAGYEAWPLF